MSNLAPQPGSENKKSNSGRQWLRRALITCIVLAIACFAGRVILQARHSGTASLFTAEAMFEIGSEALLHLAIGFVVAGTVIAAVEMKAQQVAEEENLSFRDQISRDVYKALYGRILPPKVFEEIHTILHFDIVRTDCEYLITFLPPYPDMPEGSFIIRRQVAYTVQNLLNERHPFMARSFHSEDAEFSSEAWKGRKFHLKLIVDGKEIPLIEGENLTTGSDFAKIVQEVPLDPKQAKRISFHGEEPVLISAGRISYLQGTPVTGIKVTISNTYPEKIRDAEVLMNHPGADQMTTDDFGNFILDRAFLPGQGFQVKWKKVKQEEERTTAEEG